MFSFLSKDDDMKSSIFRKSPWATIRTLVTPLLFTVIVIVLVISGLEQTEASSRAEGLRILEESITRAVVLNYAITGKYPQSLAYIEENFGIFIDRSRFVVHYSVSGSNIFPDIFVFELPR